MQRKPERAALAISASYLVLGACWILVSDHVLEWVTRGRVAELQTYKGWFFVLVTAILLYRFTLPVLRSVHQSEASSRRSIQTLRELIAASPLATIVVDGEGHILEWNKAAERTLGWTLEEISGRKLPLARGSVAHSLPEDARGAESVLLRKDGSPVPVELWTASISQAAGRSEGTVILLADITDRKAAAEALRQSEERLRRAIVDAPFPIMIHQGDGTVALVNQAWSALTGYRRDDLPTVSNWTATVFRGVELPAPRNAPAEPGREIKVYPKAGGERLWDVLSTSLGKLPDGTALTSTMAVDLTVNRSLEQQFLQAQKMEAVGRLAGGVAHDFNNLLTVILGHAYLLRSTLQQPAQQSSAAEIEKAAQTASTLTRQLLVFSRRNVVQRTSLDVVAVLANMESMLRRLIGENIQLTLEHDPGPCMVEADPGQLEQVIMNLSVNARDVMPDGGEVVLAVHCVEPEAVPEAARHAAARFVAVSVADTGPGVPADVRDRIFEPFFTTKPGGTGLGLSTVFAIAAQNGGTVEVGSRPQGGAVFTVYLPQAPAASPQLEPESQREPAQRGPAVVLIAEDDASLRSLASQTLQSAGYVVLEAGDPASAERVFDACQLPIDLLLTDVIMPGGNGVDLAASLARRSPQLKVLFMSGYSDERVPEEAAAHYLAKPFTPRVLLKRVAEALDSR